MNGFNTFEKQDKVLLGLNSGSDAAAAMRILQQQGFAVQTSRLNTKSRLPGFCSCWPTRLPSWTARSLPPGTMPASEVDGEGLSSTCCLPANDRGETRVPRCRSAAGSAG